MENKTESSSSPPGLVLEDYSSFRVGVEVTEFDLSTLDLSDDLGGLECHVRVANCPARAVLDSEHQICVTAVPDSYGVIIGEAFIFMRNGSEGIRQEDILGYTWFFVIPEDSFSKRFKLQKNQDSIEPAGHISLTIVSSAITFNVTKGSFALSEFGSMV